MKERRRRKKKQHSQAQAHNQTAAGEGQAFSRFVIFIHICPFHQPSSSNPMSHENDQMEMKKKENQQLLSHLSSFSSRHHFKKLILVGPTMGHRNSSKPSLMIVHKLRVCHGSYRNCAPSGTRLVIDNGESRRGLAPFDFRSSFTSGRSYDLAGPVILILRTERIAI